LSTPVQFCPHILGPVMELLFTVDPTSESKSHCPSIKLKLYWEQLTLIWHSSWQ
jgi:hypothetical protein